MDSGLARKADVTLRLWFGILIADKWETFRGNNSFVLGPGGHAAMWLHCNESWWSQELPLRGHMGDLGALLGCKAIASAEISLCVSCNCCWCETFRMVHCMMCHCLHW